MHISQFLKIYKKKRIILITILFVLIVTIIALSIGITKHTGGTITENVAVTRRDITSTITGSAVVMPKDQYSVTSLITGEITSASFEEGDIVRKGDVLYRIDAKDIEKDIKSAEINVQKARQNYNDAITSKQKNSKSAQQDLDRAQVSLDISQKDYESSKHAAENLIIKSDIKGTVQSVLVKEGEYIREGTVVATVYNDESLKVNIPFNEDDAAAISTGQSAVLTLTDTGDVLDGIVESVDTASVTEDGHMKVRYVTIIINEPKALTVSDSVIASVGNIFCNNSGKLEYIQELSVTAIASGTVKSVNIEPGNRVNAGDTIITLENENLNTQVEKSALAVDDAEISYDKANDNLDSTALDSQIKTAKLALDEALIALEKTKSAADDYVITAPISGRIVTKNAKTGDKIDAVNKQEPMTVIYDMSSLEFELMIDELDINKISLNQEVKITADALSGKNYIGYVKSISINGTQSNGVTSYPVSVSISDFDENLLPGMNIDAEITVNQVKNVLSVPKNAVTRDNIVYVVGKKENPDDTAPEGYKSVNVVTGINDGSYIEIISGLSENDKVKAETMNTSSFPFGFSPGAVPVNGGMSGGGVPQ